MTSIRLVSIKVGTSARSARSLNPQKSRRRDRAHIRKRKRRSQQSRVNQSSNCDPGPTAPTRASVRSCVHRRQIRGPFGPLYTSKLPTHRTSPRLSGTFRAGDRPAAVHRRKRLVFNSSRPSTNTVEGSLFTESGRTASYAVAPWQARGALETPEWRRCRDPSRVGALECRRHRPCFTKLAAREGSRGCRSGCRQR